MAEANPNQPDNQPQDDAQAGQVDPEAQADQEAQAATATATAEADEADVQEVELPDAGGEVTSGEEGKIDLLLDAMIPITVQVGTVEMPIRELLKLGQGSVLKLAKRIGQPVDLFIRGIRFATGDIVVIGDQLGVRIREILSSQAIEDGSA
jgi:flagellar motor switch protein FliN/FliY